MLRKCVARAGSVVYVDMTPDEEADFERGRPARVRRPRHVGTDAETVRRLEAAAARVNGAAANAADVEQLKSDLKDLAIVVQEMAVRGQIPDGAPTVDLSGLEADIKALTDQLSANRMLHDEASRRLTDIEGGLSMLIARLDDLYAWHDRLASQVNQMASFRPDRRMQPPADLPPPPATGHQSGWVKGVLGGMSDDDPLPEAPELAQEADGNETAPDHAQQVNAVREARTAAELANQHLTIEETRHLTVEDRWAKPFARYQLALQAKNGSLGAKRILAPAAERYGLEIEVLAEKIIGEWKEIEQQIMAEY